MDGSGSIEGFALPCAEARGGAVPCLGAPPAVAGYHHPLYAASLAEFGDPVQLPGSGGWLLVRSIPGAEGCDAMGLYPLFCCSDWRALRSDLEGRQAEWVSVAVITDPFGDYDPALLRSTFDVVRPFKQHYVADLSQPLDSFLGSHHRRHARNALRAVSISCCQAPSRCLAEWIRLYGCLSGRHQIRGIRGFSRTAFARQMEVPGIVAFCARLEGRLVGMDLWYLQGGVAYNHLLAVSPDGYRVHAAYALQRVALEVLGRQVRWASFGGRAGLEDQAGDGLARFKQGWSNTTRTAWFCGSILDADRYAALVQRAGAAGPGYFPAYRRGEFD